MSLSQLPLPTGPLQPRTTRLVTWPEGMAPRPWVCLMPRPLLFRTHWCPGASERGAPTRGRSAPCFRNNCPRCPHPKQFPAQQLLVFGALNPKAEVTTAVVPGHLAHDVQAHAGYSGTWLGAILTLSRPHAGRTAEVQLVGLDYAPGEELPPPPDVCRALSKLWSRYCQDGWDGDPQWAEVRDRDPGQEG